MSQIPLLAKDELVRLRSLIARLGERRALEVLATSRLSLARLLAGLPVRRGTLALMRHGLKESEKQIKKESVVPRTKGKSPSSGTQ